MLARPHMTPSLRNIVLLLALAACWGSNYALIKLALTGMPPATMTLGRVALAAAVLVLVMRAQKHEWPREPKAWLGMAGVGVFGNALPYFLISSAEEQVSSALAAILITTTPLLTMLAAHWAFADERLTPRRLIGVIVGFVGVVVLVGPEALSGLGADLFAQTLLIGAACCFAISIVVARMMPPIPTATSSAGALLIGTVLVFPAAVGDGLDVDPTWTAIAACAALGLISTAAATLIYMHLAKAVGANFVASANYIAPLIATGLGIVLLAERPGWPALAALALILFGTWIANARR